MEIEDDEHKIPKMKRDILSKALIKLQNKTRYSTNQP